MKIANRKRQAARMQSCTQKAAAHAAAFPTEHQKVLTSDDKNGIGLAKGVLNTLAGVGICNPVAIHHKPVLMPTGWEGERCLPGTGLVFAHRRARGVPIVESACYADGDRLGHRERERGLALVCFALGPCGFALRASSR